MSKMERHYAQMEEALWLLPPVPFEDIEEFVS